MSTSLQMSRIYTITCSNTNRLSEVYGRISCKLEGAQKTKKALSDNVRVAPQIERVKISTDYFTGGMVRSLQTTRRVFPGQYQYYLAKPRCHFPQMPVETVASA